MKQKFSVVALLAVLAALTAFGGVARPSIAAQTTPTATPVPGAGLVKAADTAEAQKLTASGATFPQKLYAAWFAEYKKVTGVEVTYGGGGSGKGKNDVFADAVDFGGTDAYITDKEYTDKTLKQAEILHIPTAIGAVVMITNIPEAQNQQVKFTAANIAEIYSLKIKKWNDPKLVADNPFLKEVNKDIVVVRREDASGTTSIFTTYLAAANADWKAAYGAGGTEIKWAADTIGGKGNDGVAGQVKQNSYAIGYVELIFARANKLSFGSVQSPTGKFINPSLASVTDAAGSFLKNTPDDLRVSIVNSAGDTAYPISGYTWLIVKANQKDAAKARAIARLFWWATHDGQAFNEGLDFSPLPADVVKKAEQQIAKITVDGKPALPEEILKTIATGASRPAATATK